MFTSFLLSSVKALFPRGRRVNGRQRKPVVIEQLESRRLLSASVLQFHNDNGSTGQNLNETNLTQANVASDLALLHTAPLDGEVFAQPLYVSGVNISAGAVSGVHDVVYVATENDSVYAIDAHSGQILWWDSLLGPTALQAGDPSMQPPAPSVPGTTIIAIPAGDFQPADSQNGPTNPGQYTSSLGPEIGITGTPVIDPATDIMYVVAQERDTVGTGATAVTHYVLRLHAINITNGQEAAPATVIADTISNTYPLQTYDAKNNIYSFTDPDTPGATPTVFVTGTGDGSVGGVIDFDARIQLVRPALTLVHETIGGVNTPVVFLASGSYGDFGPYHGWVIGYAVAAGSAPQLVAVFNTAPMAQPDAGPHEPSGTAGSISDLATFDDQASIWQSGGSIATDAAGNLYVITGNGAFGGQDGSTLSLGGDGMPLTANYGDTFLKLSFNSDSTATIDTRLMVADYFTPYNQGALNLSDEDAGSTGPLLLPSPIAGADGGQLLAGADKDGTIYILDTANMGKFSLTTDLGRAVSEGTVPVPSVLPAGATNPVVRIFGNLAYYDNMIYAGAELHLTPSSVTAMPLQVFEISDGGIISGATSANGMLVGGQPVAQSADTFNLRGTTVSISANPSHPGSAIAWAIDYEQNSSGGDGGGELRAYVPYEPGDTSGVLQEIYTGTNEGAGAGSATRFSVPTVADGQVFVAKEGQLEIYGLQSPTITVTAAANPNPVVTGTQTTLTVTAADPGGNAALLTYNWLPPTEGSDVASGTPVPTFSDNDDNTASTTTATFHGAGTYTFTVTVSNGSAQPATSSVTVLVEQAATSVSVTPATAIVLVGGPPLQLTAAELDQFGHPMTSQPTFTWSIFSFPFFFGVGTVTPTGPTTANYQSTVMGSATVIAAAPDELSGAASITVVNSVAVLRDWNLRFIPQPIVIGDPPPDFDGRQWTISGNGGDIGGLNDQFTYVYQAIPGNVTLSGQVTSLVNAGDTGKAGLMVRDGTATNAAFAGVFVTADEGIVFEWRTAAGMAAASTTVSDIGDAVSLRLIKQGNSIQAFYSTDGREWTQIGAAVTVAMASPTAGMAVTSNDVDGFATATFDQVTVNTPEHERHQHHRRHHHHHRDERDHRPCEVKISKPSKSKRCDEVALARPEKRKRGRG